MALSQQNAENLLKALSGAGPLSELLPCIADMRVILPHTGHNTCGAGADSAAVLDAFSALALASKNTQVCGMLIVRPQQQVLHPLS